MSLEQRMREKIRVQGKSRETFKTYWQHCEDFLRFCKANGIGRETPARQAVEEWLTDMACNRNVSKNSQNLALQSVCYLYKHVLGRELRDVSAIRAKRPTQMRDCISVEEVAMLFAELDGLALLVAQMIYGTGLRIGKVMDLRIKDISFERCQLMIKTAKGDKGRYTSFPTVLHDRVRQQMESVRVLHKFDLRDNPNGVSLPGAFRKKSPKACSEFRWYYLFPSDNLSRDDNGVLCRHHRQGDHFTTHIKQAADRAGIDKRVTSHILRHSYATHANEQGVDVTHLQQLLGHSDIRTTMIYVHANKDKVTASHSPLEALTEQLANPRSRNVPVHNGRPALRVVG